MTMAPTPIATQTKKNSRRRHDARTSRSAIRATNFILALRSLASSHYASDDAAVAQRDRRVGALRQLRVVRDEDDGGLAAAVDVEQEIDDLVPGGGVEIPGRFVGEQDGGIVGEGASDGDTLLLAARELRRVMMSPRSQADLGEQCVGARRRRRRCRRSRGGRARSRRRSATAAGGRTGTRSRCASRGTAPASSSDIAVMSCPSITMRPVEGASSPASSPSRVDLPLPDGPTMAATGRTRCVRSSGCRIVSIVSPLGTVLETPVSSIIAPAPASTIGLSAVHTLSATIARRRRSDGCRLPG